MAGAEVGEWMDGQTDGWCVDEGSGPLAITQLKFKVLEVSGGVWGFHTFLRYCTCNNSAPLVPLQ